MQVTQGLIGLLAFTAIFSRNPKLIVPIPNYLIVKEKNTSEVIRQLADLDTSEVEREDILVSHVLDLDNRDESEFVNKVFKDNILLSLDYLGSDFFLQPDEVFAFHENVLSEFKSKTVKTMGSKFIASEGYRSSGWIFGDGVCHLASLINWTAQGAGLETIAKVRHDFRSIPGVPRDYWTSIRYSPSGHNSQNQNLYIVNTFDYSVIFKFEVVNNNLRLKILKPIN